MSAVRAMELRAIRSKRRDLSATLDGLLDEKAALDARIDEVVARDRVLSLRREEILKLRAGQGADQ